MNSRIGTLAHKNLVVFNNEKIQQKNCIVASMFAIEHTGVGS